MMVRRQQTEHDNIDDQDSPAIVFGEQCSNLSRVGRMRKFGTSFLLPIYARETTGVRKIR